MTFFIDLASEDEQVNDLIRFISQVKFSKSSQEKKEESSASKSEEGKETNAESYREELTKLYKEDLIGLLSQLFVDLEAVFSEAQDTEIESCTYVVGNLLRKVPEDQVQAKLRTLISLVTSNKSDRPGLRLKILNNLFNIFDRTSILRYPVFVAIVQYAVDSGNSESIIPHFRKVDDWVKEWGCNALETRTCFLAIRKVLKDTDRSVQAHKALVRYLTTFNGSEPSVLSTATQEAVTASVEAIKLPEIFQCDDLLEISAIKYLQEDGQHSKLYELLKLFAVEKLDAFYAFHEKNPDFLESVGLTYEDCLKKIRLLSIATLASEEEEVPYSRVMATLKIQESEVEPWIVLAIGTKLIDARMDQIRRVIIINSTTQRVFTVAQWKQLGARLSSWKENVRNLINVIDTTRHASSLFPPTRELKI